jgi:alpha-N-acetylglucosaminidase
MLHNFGGNQGLYGQLELIASAPLQALQSAGKQMVGMGITMEVTEKYQTII